MRTTDRLFLNVFYSCFCRICCFINFKLIFTKCWYSLRLILFLYWLRFLIRFFCSAQMDVTIMIITVAFPFLTSDPQFVAFPFLTSAPQFVAFPFLTSAPQFGQGLSPSVAIYLLPKYLFNRCEGHLGIFVPLSQL